MNVKATRQIGSNFYLDFFEDTFLQLKVLKAVFGDVRIEILKPLFKEMQFEVLIALNSASFVICSMFDVIS